MILTDEEWHMVGLTLLLCSLPVAVGLYVVQMIDSTAYQILVYILIQASFIGGLAARAQEKL